MNPDDEDRAARVTLSFLAEPGEPAIGALLRCCGPGEVVAAVMSGDEPRLALPAAAAGLPGLARAFKRWRARLGRIPSAARLAAWELEGFRLLCPGDPEWPTQLDVLADAQPVVLWLRAAPTSVTRACARYRWWVQPILRPV